jgi:hypothetical protein
MGNITAPQLGGSLTLSGRDSKIHVVDYSAGSTHIVYSTGEIATWATIGERDVIVLYGNEGETHETAFKSTSTPVVVSGKGKIMSKVVNGVLVVNYVTTGQTVFEVDDKTLVYVLGMPFFSFNVALILIIFADRVNAYEFWSLNLPDSQAGKFAAFNTRDTVLVKGGYLIRSVDLKSGTLSISGDLNSTTSFEIIAPPAATKVSFNGQNLSVKKTKYGTLLATKNSIIPAATLPNLKSITWVSMLLCLSNVACNDSVHRNLPIHSRKSRPRTMTHAGRLRTIPPQSVPISPSTRPRCFTHLIMVIMSETSSGAVTSLPPALRPPFGRQSSVVPLLGTPSGSTIRSLVHGWATPYPIVTTPPSLSPRL